MTLIRCSIIVLNCNGKQLLEESLPSVLAAVRQSRFETDIWVVDNGSSDGSIDYVKHEFPTINLLALDQNYQFSGGNNRGVEAARGDVVVLLNNDMVVEPSFLDPLLAPFESQDDLFAVTSQIFLQDQNRVREETGKTFAYWDHGIIRVLHQPITPESEMDDDSPVFYAGGGSSAYHREKYLALGGFRTIFNPGYVEDTDLSYRAWKRGWKSILATASIVHHKHRATNKKRFTDDEFEILIKRNELIFIWTNLSNARLLLEHFFLLPLRFLKSLFEKRGFIVRRAIFQAVKRIIEVNERSAKNTAAEVLSDSYLLCSHRWRTLPTSTRKKHHVLYVSPYVPSVGRHGGGVAMYNVIKGQSESFTVSLLSYYGDEEERRSASAIGQCCSEVILVPRKRGEVFHDWFHIRPHHVMKEFYDQEMRERIHAAARSGRFDLIQFEYLEMAHWAREIKQYNIPLVLMHHEVQHSALRTKRDHQRSFVSSMELFWKWMKVLNYEISIAALYDRIIVVTDDDRTALTDYDASLPVQVIPAGVDIQYYEKEMPSPVREHSLVFVGNFRHFPNEDAMLFFSQEILPRIVQTIPEVTLHIVGADPTHPITNLHNGNTIVVHGRVDDIRPHLASASLFVAPLRYGAGMRLKILEAWATKKAVVTTTLGAAGIGARNGENIAIADSPAKFASAVVELLQDHKRRNTLAENGYETARSFDWAFNVATRTAIFRSLLQEESA
ncbi:MAG: glycosyltransferase [bacterium]